MSRPDRYSSCEGKARYTSRQLARKVITTGGPMRRRRMAALRPYHCGYCGMWHIGHPVDRRAA